MKLYLVRHAIAEEHLAAAAPAKTKSKLSSVGGDAERALTEQGKAKMARAAQGLRKIKVRLDLILTSPLRRARETAEIVAQELEGTKIEVFNDLAPGTEPSALVAALRPYHSLRAIALVGHQPDLGHLASYLLTGSPNGCDLSLKKGSVACLEGELAQDATSCNLLWLMTPKLLRSI